VATRINHTQEATAAAAAHSDEDEDLLSGLPDFDGSADEAEHTTGGPPAISFPLASAKHMMPGELDLAKTAGARGGGGVASQVAQGAKLQIWEDPPEVLRSRGGVGEKGRRAPGVARGSWVWRTSVAAATHGHSRRPKSSMAAKQAAVTEEDHLTALSAKTRAWAEKEKENPAQVVPGSGRSSRQGGTGPATSAPAAVAGGCAAAAAAAARPPRRRGLRARATEQQQQQQRQRRDHGGVHANSQARRAAAAPPFPTRGMLQMR
jgi:hypothetical protein